MAGGWRTIRRLLPVMANLEVANCIHDAIEHAKASVATDPTHPPPRLQGPRQVRGFCASGPVHSRRAKRRPLLKLSKIQYCELQGRPLWQGNRISILSDEFLQESIVPCGPVKFGSKGAFGSIIAHDVESHVSQDCQVFWGFIESGAGLILAEHDVEAPVEAVFDAPMGADDLGKAGG
jgi:hypothetical protein